VNRTTEYFEPLQALVCELRWWGGLTAQTKLDARDGILKLMELNPRLGTHLWYRTEAGVNVPRLCLTLAEGGVVSETGKYAEGAILLDPIEDLLGLPFELLDLFLYTIRTIGMGLPPTDSLNSPPSLAAMIQQYKSDYAKSRRKIYSPYVRQLLRDPLPCLLRYYAYLGHLLRGVKDRGR
jgi:hypothetical protein